MPDFLPNGIGGTVADSLVTGVPLLISGRIWYVDSQTGDATNSGKDRKFPFALIQEAVAAIGGQDDHIIICLSGHTQSVSVGTLGDRVTIAGEGAIDGIPTVILHGAPGAGPPAIRLEADGIEIRNIRFAGVDDGLEGSHPGYIAVEAAGCLLRGCVFDMDPGMDQDAGVELEATTNDCRFENCVWRAVSTTSPVVARPLQGVRVAATLARLVLEDCTFDGGLHGFDDGSGNPYAFDSAAFVITPLRVLRMSLLNGADFKVHEDTPGYNNPQASTGHAKVEW